ncbi:MAG TPA: YciI family protein [Candidatus Limnocylindria bacterium]|nr:YciI family protein [Candidatus Limnocylindria bacterium]
MKYAILIFDENTASPSPEPPDPAEWGQVMEEYNAYTKMLRDNGLYLGGEALEPNPSATTIRIRDGKTLTTDGPFAETKEALGGFYLVEARDLDHALQLAAACPGAKWGSIEVRPVVSFPDADAVPVGEGAAVTSA